MADPFVRFVQNVALSGVKARFRPNLNFIGVSMVDNAATDSTDITVAAGDLTHVTTNIIWTGSAPVGGWRVDSDSEGATINLGTIQASAINIGHGGVLLGIVGGTVSLAANELDVTCALTAYEIPEASCVTTDGTTPVALTSISVPEGYMVIVKSIIGAVVRTGSNAGKTYALITYASIKNPDGTAVVATVTTPASAVEMGADETSGGIVGVFDAPISGGVVTIRVKGQAANTIDWSQRIIFEAVIPLVQP